MILLYVMNVCQPSFFQDRDVCVEKEGILTTQQKNVMIVTTAVNIVMVLLIITVFTVAWIRT